MSKLEIYLAVITTVLVATQVIRLVQNTISLRRNKKVFMKQLGHLDDVTREDMEMQRKANRCIVEWYESATKRDSEMWKDVGADLCKFSAKGRE